MKRVWFNGRDAATLPWWRLQIGMVGGFGDAEMPNAQLREVGRIAVVGKGAEVCTQGADTGIVFPLAGTVSMGTETHVLVQRMDTGGWGAHTQESLAEAMRSGRLHFDLADRVSREAVLATIEQAIGRPCWLHFSPHHAATPWSVRALAASGSQVVLVTIASTPALAMASWLAKWPAAVRTQATTLKKKAAAHAKGDLEQIPDAVSLIQAALDAGGSAQAGAA